MKLKLRIALYAGSGILLGALLSGACGGGGGNNSGPAPAKSGDLIWSRANNPSGSFDEVSAMAKDANALYIVGYDQVPGYARWRIEKRNLSDGTLANSFGSGGALAVDTGRDAWASAIALDSNYMYIAGVDTTPALNYEWRIEKRDLTSGNLVSSFGTASTGIISSGTISTDAESFAIAIDSQYLYVAGYDTLPSGNIEWRIEKRNKSDGSLVATFDGDGVMNSDPSVGDDSAISMAVDANALYVLGIDSVDGSITYSWRMEKLDITSGATVTTIRSNSNPYACDAVPYAIAVNASSMYIVGYDIEGDCSTPNWYYVWKAEKRDLAGVPDNSFGSNGSVITNLSSLFSDAIPNAVAMDASYLYVTGFDTNTATGDEQWRIEKRNLSDGSLVQSFGSGGVVNSNANTSTGAAIRLNEAYAIVVDDSYLYAAGLDSLSDTDAEWRIEKRLK